MINDKLDAFILCLNEQRFYDAHEALEAIWFPRRFEKSNEVKLLKGFINASVSFELYKLGRIEQSKKVWANYIKYRQLLLKIDSEHRNRYFQLSRQLEAINHQKVTKTIKL